MKRNLVLLGILTVFSLPLYAQTGSVKGTCRDADGKPITDAQVVWHNTDNGRTYTLKTNKKGEYFSLGVEPGQYTITLNKDGKELDSVKNFHAGVDESDLDFDLKKSQEQAVQQTAKQTGMTAEQVKKMQEENVKAAAYNANIKVVNAKLQQATALLQAQPPNYDQAIAILQDCTQQVPNEDVVWFRLGAAYLDDAHTQTDAAEKTKLNTEAFNDLQKALDLKKAKDQAGTPAKNPADAAAETTRMAAYYDNYGTAAARLGKLDQAADSYKQAATLDPSHAANYYFNLGAVLTNSATDANGKKAAADAFDKAIAADPNKADAYYWKGSNLIALATADSSGKLSAPDGTAEAFQKYLDLQPNGPHADEAKQMLQVLNAQVETSFGKKGTSPKKK